MTTLIYATGTILGIAVGLACFVLLAAIYWEVGRWASGFLIRLACRKPMSRREEQAFQYKRWKLGYAAEPVNLAQAGGTRADAPARLP